MILRKCVFLFPFFIGVPSVYVGTVLGAEGTWSSNLPVRSALREGPWGGSTGKAARWTTGCIASVCRQLTYCVQTSQSASLSLCFHLDESQGVVLFEQPFLGFSFLMGPCLPSRSSPQTQLSRKGGSGSQGRKSASSCCLR